VDSGHAFSPYLLTISDELMGMVRRILRGVEMNEDRLARGLIDDVQPGGHYLDTSHTRYYFKSEQFWPALMNRKRIDDWVAEGSRPLGVRAVEKTKELLTFSQARQLDKAISDKLVGILKSAAA
jgi:trimethylamine--corrinoid protein Co-methyltransferase